jgi:hypothetical protein
MNAPMSSNVRRTQAPPGAFALTAIGSNMNLLVPIGIPEGWSTVTLLCEPMGWVKIGHTLDVGTSVVQHVIAPAGAAIDGMLRNMPAAIARKNYEDRRRMCQAGSGPW